ncbi:iron-containing alcohol dehydrogenase [Oceanospirillum sediminis]|uniref:Iron-containing alcohol dehydrogenase n=1 Tax=Oceanospirillum sediminis TaxID=2760088 RepID=A0A839IQP9_9GAMM|nr:iron-containing alcohol dehydrogenase [Oceanospirillum sediminis]MBB1487585.1 iron-containing alcohol dehydrogenase [Oceanospirillum sediminis]
MLDFDYYNPTHIVFGQDRLNELDKLIPETARVMVIFGGQSAKKFGTIDRVKDVLKSREVIEFGGIEPNPQFDTLIRATELAKEKKIDFLLAVGGGSVMDGTKFIALATKTPADEYHNLLSHGFSPVPATDALPLGCIATLPATGSEMNMAGVITFNEQKYPFMSPLVFPKFSLLDPELTLTLPKEQIANGIVDAFIHVLEQYLTVPVNAKIQDRIAEGVLKTLIEDGPATFDDNEDIEARKNFIWSATTALCGSIGSGVPQDWSTHMIGHELTAMYGIAHGRTLAIVLPSLLRERKDKKHAKLLQFAERVWDISEGTEEEKVALAIDKTEAFFNNLEVSTRLSDYGIEEAGIDNVIVNMEKMGLTTLSESGDLTLDIVRKILVAAY